MKNYSIKKIRKIDFKKQLLQPDPYTYGCECSNICKERHKVVWKKQHDIIKIHKNDYIIGDNQ